MSTHFDVIVVGGGNVGASLACALGASGVKVACVEARTFTSQWAPASVDLRVFAITRASQCLFDSLHVWDAMVAEGVSPYSGMQVWDAGGKGEICFDCADLGEPTLGHIIEQRVIQKALLARMAALPQVSFFCPVAIESLQVENNVATVQLNNGQQLSSPLVVGADGAHSLVRELAGLETSVKDYGQTAVVAVVETELPHEEIARQRFLDTGPLAFLPLREGRCSIVWSTSPDHAQALLAMGDAEFQLQLGEAFDFTLGDICSVGERGMFPLRRMHAPHYVAPHIALVGDAAHTIHPLAGQGVNLGLLDVAALAEVVVDARGRGRDVGSLATLRRYERWRKGDNQLMQSAMDGFKSLFGSQQPALRLMRNAGLSLVDGAGPVKHEAMRYAMGLAGDLPRLSRGHALPYI